MLPIDKLPVAGDHPFTFQGKAGRLEAVMSVPSVISGNRVALLGHPHSLQGGTMNNKVVTTLARAFKDLGIPALRFNFRGVGCSEGVYDAGMGESEDMQVLANLWAEHHECPEFLCAGFSFGSFVAYRAACALKAGFLLTVAPPVHHFDYQSCAYEPALWHIFQGDKDEVVPLQTVLDFAKNHKPSLPVQRFAETGHFFHGKLMDIKDCVQNLVKNRASAG